MSSMRFDRKVFEMVFLVCKYRLHFSCICVERDTTFSSWTKKLLLIGNRELRRKNIVNWIGINETVIEYSTVTLEISTI